MGLPVDVRGEVERVADRRVSVVGDDLARVRVLVLPPVGDVGTLTGLYEEVAARGGHVHSQVRRQEVAPADDDVAEALGLAPGSPIVLIERLRFVDDDPWSWTTTYLPLKLGSLVLDDDLSDQSLYALLEQHGIRAKRGVRSAEAMSATEDQAHLLGVTAGQALLVLRSVSYDEADQPMEFFIAHHRGDRSRFEFQLSAPNPDKRTRRLSPPRGR